MLTKYDEKRLAKLFAQPSRKSLKRYFEDMDAAPEEGLLRLAEEFGSPLVRYVGNADDMTAYSVIVSGQDLTITATERKISGFELLPVMDWLERYLEYFNVEYVEEVLRPAAEDDLPRGGGRTGRPAGTWSERFRTVQSHAEAEALCDELAAQGIRATCIFMPWSGEYNIAWEA